MTFYEPTVWYHKTSGDLHVIKPFIHIGTIEQATMRAAGSGANVVSMYALVSGQKLKRLVDTGSWHIRKLQALERRGFEGVVYLNRFEGIPLEEFEAARTKVGDIDSLSDAQFRKLLPSARDSLIVFSPEHIRLVHSSAHRMSAPG